MKKSMLFSFTIVAIVISLSCFICGIIINNDLFDAFQLISLGFMFLFQYMINIKEAGNKLAKIQLITSVITFGVGFVHLLMYLLK